jgi:hypothetical protein
LTGLGQLVVAWLIFGTTTMAAYIRTVGGLPRLATAFEPFPHEGHSLYGFFRLLLPDSAVSVAYGVTVIPVVMCAVLAWRAAVPLPLKFMALVLATALVSPHLLTYDLTITLAALLPLWGWLNRLRSTSYGGSPGALAAAEGPALRTPASALRMFAAVSAYLVYFTPAVLIAKIVHVQPTTVSMLLLLAAVTLLSRPFAARAAS